MKLNKKIAVPILSTAMGLSLIGGVGGAVAWYQYNSRVTASFVGSSVADSTVLQIGKWVGDQNTGSIQWGRNVDFGQSNKLVPVTFGALLDNDSLPNKAYGYPEAGVAPFTSWTEVAANDGYVQFKVYLRAYDITNTDASGKKQAARDVFLSDLTLNEVIPNNTQPRKAGDALMMHIAVKDGDNFLISKNGGSISLSGNLDLDGINGDDLKDENEYVWNQTGSNEKVKYGYDDNDTHTLTSVAKSNIVVARDQQTGFMPKSGDSDYSKKICTTSATELTEITVTVWLEGWALLGGNNDSAIWNAYDTAGSDLQLGLTFDCGRKRPA